MLITMLIRAAINNTRNQISLILRENKENRLDSSDRSIKCIKLEGMIHNILLLDKIRHDYR